MKVAARKREDGFTLVELLIAIVLMTLVTGAVSAAFATAINGSSSTTQRVRESDDAQIVATYLVRDAQAAGGTNPLTASADPTLGVSLTDNAGCAGPSGAPVVRFKWNDYSAPKTSITRTAVYFYDAATKQLVRRTCTGSGTLDGQLTLSENVASATATCATAGVTGPCNPTLPDSISLAVVSTNKPFNSVTPYSFTLTASVRPESQIAPTSLTGRPVPLLALGGGSGCSAGATGLDLEGTPGARIYGDVVINAKDSGSCHAMNATGSVDFIAGGTAILLGGTCTGSECPSPVDTYTTPLGDPYAGLTPPAGSCSTGTHSGPTSSGGTTTYSPGVYTSAVNFSGNNVLTAGNYVFCNGITNNNANVNGAGVLLYIAHGGMTMTGGNTILSAATDAGNPYAGIVIWQADASTWSTSGNASVGLTGTLYAPKGTVILAGTADSAYQSIIAAVISIQGTHTITIGNAPATPLAITGPASLPAWTRNQPYPATTVISTGGSGAGLVWTATGLPAGMTIDPSLGTITGTPGASGTFAVGISLSDSLGDTASQNYTLTINAALAVTGPSSLPSRTVGRPYPPTTMTATGGTPSITWSATGLPAGLTMSGAGVITGTPTAAGPATVVVTATDATGATATRSYSFTINAAPTITTNSLPNGQTTLAYSATLAGSGGTTAYSWSATGLPAGLAISTGGVISGTPTAAGTFSVSVTLTDASGATAPATLSINVSQVLLITAPTTANLPAWTVNRGYPVGTTVTASGGTAPYTWSATGLPTGLSINAGTGAITGLPTVANAYSVIVTVKDSAAQQATATKSYSLVINPNPTIATTIASVKKRDTLSFQLATAGGTGPFTWSMSGTIPSWVSLSTSGVLSGTAPNSPTSYPAFTVTATDASGVVVSHAFTLTVTN